jgi:hypothetical protein
MSINDNFKEEKHMAVSTYGTVFKYGATSADKTLAIKSYPQIMAKRAALETTTLSDDAKTYIAGIRETPDSLDFTMNYDAAIFAEINALDAVQKCELTFSDGSGFTFDGFLSASNNDGAVNAVAEMTISVMPATVPVFKAST